MTASRWCPVSTEVAEQQRAVWLADVVSGADERGWLHAGKGQHKQIHVRPVVHQGLPGDIFNKVHRLK